MFHSNSINRDETGQTALETAIILIAFVVVASVFAFTILSAGTSTTEKGEEAIYAGLESVQSTMALKGAVIAEGAAGKVTTVLLTLSLVSGGDPVDMTNPVNNVVVVDYRDGAQIVSNITWTAAKVVGDADMLLEDGEMFEMTVDLAGLTTPLATNTEFTIEVKPPTGAVINVNRTTPPAITAVMELR